MSTVTSLMSQLRQPEYTGENRCVPCTALNVVIAAALSAGIVYWARVANAEVAAAAAAGIASFAGFAGAIYLRGYLVPYTPTITKRYFPDRVLRWFDKAPETDAVGASDDLDVEATLLSLEVLRECENHDDLCLVPSFQRAWREQITQLRDADTDGRQEVIAELFELDDEHSIEEHGVGAASVMVDGTHVGQWESEAALVADLAADRALRERSGRWADFHVADRGRLLNSLRMFLERCPACDAPVEMGQETVESCCRSMDVVAVTCSACNARLFEVELGPELQQQL